MVVYMQFSEDSSIITDSIRGLTSGGCLFKKHTPEY